MTAISYVASRTGVYQMSSSAPKEAKVPSIPVIANQFQGATVIHDKVRVNIGGMEFCHPVEIGANGVALRHCPLKNVSGATFTGRHIPENELIARFPPPATSRAEAVAPAAPKPPPVAKRNPETELGRLERLYGDVDSAIDHPLHRLAMTDDAAFYQEEDAEKSRLRVLLAREKLESILSHYDRYGNPKAAVSTAPAKKGKTHAAKRKAETPAPHVASATKKPHASASSGKAPKPLASSI